MNVNYDFLRTYKHLIKHGSWSTISRYFLFPISYKEIVDFENYWNYDLLLDNPNLIWTDENVFDIFADNWHLITNYWVYNNLFKPVCETSSIEELIEAINLNNKFAKIIWTSEDKMVGIVSVYVKSVYEYQEINSGYIFSTKPLMKGKEIQLPNDIKIKVIERESLYSDKPVKEIIFYY